MRRFFNFCALVWLAAHASALWSGNPRDSWKGAEYAKNSESQKASAEDFLGQTEFKGSEQILDVGCGDGKITAAMAAKVPLGSVVGLDISHSMIEAAKGALTQQKNLSFQIGDAAKLNYDQQFDLITSFTVMQWVLEQKAALKGFEKALKPGGRVWIQMPTGLPQPMQQALEKVLSKDCWKSYFDCFSSPWQFYDAEEYRALLLEAQLLPNRLEVVTKHELFPSRAVFQAFLKQWFPYLRPLTTEQKDLFLGELLDHYLTALPPDDQGRVSFIVERLEVEATKPSAS